MKHISIVVPKGGVLSGIEVARQVLTEANDYFVSAGDPPVFKVELVGVTGTVCLNDGMFTIKCDVCTKDLKDTDLIIIPALYVDIAKNLESNGELIEWIAQQYNRGAEIASLCIGAFMLAKTGILDGRKCTTHWKAANIFKTMFPGVQLVKEKIITDEYGIYSSGGGLSFMNLLIYLVEKYAGRDAAVYCAKFFQVDINRDAQLPFIIFQGQKDHDDEVIKKVQEFIENNFHQKITVDDLAMRLSIGRRSLERRFKKATANTLNEYIQRVKIEAAKKHLESGVMKITDIMYEVGYSDNKAFRNSFKLLTGLLPNQYRSKYRRAVLA